MRNRLLIFGTVAVVAVVVIVGVLFMNMNATPPQTAQSTPVPTATNSETLEGSNTTNVVTENVNYFSNVNGFYAAPETAGSYPGVIMIHEWWGLNDNIKEMASTLAKEGYHVLAVDLFKGSVATTPEQARAQTSSLNQAEALQNLQGAITHLRSKNATKIAALGWCFGGGQSMQLSISGTPLDATVIYYGNLVTDSSKLSAIKWPVLGIFGDQDTSIPTEQVRAFETALNDLKVENSITIYPGVGHAFANPSGQNYAPNETRDAWNKTLTFLEQNLK